MTTPGDSGMAARPAGEEPPVWQLEPLPAEPPASTADAASEEAAIGEAATPGTAAVKKPPARLPGRARRASSTTVLLAVSAIVALGGISFAVGRVTAAGQSGTGSSTAAGANGFPGFGANASRSPIIGPGGVNGDLTSGTATVSGSVVSVTSGSITIQEANGRTVTIATGSSTAYHNQTCASGTDVTTGATVIVQTSATGAQSGSGPASASASPGTNGTRTATSVTITGS